MPVNDLTRAVTGFLAKGFELALLRVESFGSRRLMMNTRFVLIATSAAIAVLSLALVITNVGATEASVSGEAIGFEADAVIRAGRSNSLHANQRPKLSPDELLSLTEPISIYLPLLKNDYVGYPIERAALMALYNSTNGDGWYNSTGWGTDSSHCDWFGVTCDENEHVMVLDPGYNNLSGDLPPEIANLVKLRLLYLNGNRLTSLPPEIGNLVNLQELFMGDNQLTTLPPEIGNLVNLQTLALDYNQLTSLPQEIGNLTRLNSLNLGVNRLSYIPPWFGNLASLQNLYLYGNQITSIPPEMGKLVNLLALDLQANRLTSLPADLGSLENLQVLKLRDNGISSLTPWIGNMASLQYVDLGGNQILSLPPDFFNLVNLVTLDMSNNQLTSLPPDICKLSYLKELNLWSNKLSGIIPAFLSNLGNLSFLRLDYNPDLTCWETEEARDWALTLFRYYGPTCYLP